MQECNGGSYFGHGETDRASELCFCYSISNDLTHLLNSDGYLSFYWFSLKLKRRCSFSLQRHCKYYLLHLRMLEIGLQIKINLLVSLLNNRFFDKLKKYSFFVICSMLPGILNQLQVFWQLYLIEMLGTLIALNLLEL